MARIVALLFFALIFSGLKQAVTQSSMKPDPNLAADIVAVTVGYSQQVYQGAKTYDLVCSNCHGNTGLGISEGRQDFLPEHQQCESCHKPFNAARQVDVNISERNSFNIGTPPALKGKHMEKFSTAAGLYAYISTAMPRHAPGTLSSQEYLNITAYLMALNQGLGADVTLSLENLPNIPLSFF